MLLTIKDIREVLEKTLSMFYADADFAVASTKTMDKDKEFRIEFRIYDGTFWMGVDTAIDSIRICTRSLHPDGLDSIHIWYSAPFDYYKDKFEFGWRTDLEQFFDAFRENLLEKVKETQKTTAASVYGSSTKAAEIGEGEAGASVIAAILNGLDDKANDAKAKERKTSIFNGLDSDEDRDEYI